LLQTKKPLRILAQVGKLVPRLVGEMLVEDSIVIRLLQNEKVFD